MFDWYFCLSSPWNDYFAMVIHYDSVSLWFSMTYRSIGYLVSEMMNNHEENTLECCPFRSMTSWPKGWRRPCRTRTWWTSQKQLPSTVYSKRYLHFLLSFTLRCPTAENCSSLSQFECCGAESFQDWRDSRWLTGNPDINNTTPDSCCITPSLACAIGDGPSNIHYVVSTALVSHSNLLPSDLIVSSSICRAASIRWVCTSKNTSLLWVLWRLVFLAFRWAWSWNSGIWFAGNVAH